MATTAQKEPLPLADDDVGLVAWRSLIESNARLMRELDAEMQDRHGYALGDFDVLVHLAHAPNSRLRMCDLANAVLLSPSGLSRRVDRLEGAGLIERARGRSDGRNVEAKLTPAGKRRLRKLRQTHREGIKERFVDQFTGAELATLSELLTRLVPPSARTADRA
jgi:DNA-binding MarR family transcriptional regulator